MKRVLTILSVLAVTIVGAVAAVTVSYAATAAVAAWDCPSGHVCFYTGTNGTGSRCIWDIKDPDTRSGSMRCSWMARGEAARSVYNNGTSHDFTGVAYYLQTSYVNRVGCTRQGQRGNLTGTYYPRSLQWINTSCS